MIGDVQLSFAYGAARAVTVILRDSVAPYNPINVTGYTGQLRLSKNDGTTHGTSLVVVTATVGTTDGMFSASASAPQTLSLASSLGSPPRRKGRWSFWVTPPAGTITVIAHGDLIAYEEGSDVAPFSAAVYESDFSVSVSALAAPGPAGPSGPAGPTGATGPGGSTDILTTVTTTATETTLRTLTVPTGDFVIRGRTSVTDGTTTDTWEYRVRGVNTAGTVVTQNIEVISDPSSLLGQIKTTTGSNVVNIRAVPIAGSKTWLDWSMVEGT